MRFNEMVDLLEASKYDAMFGKIENLSFISNKQVILNQIQGHIDWARKNLKKEDRILWYLRLMKYKILRDIYKTYPEDNKIDQTFPNPEDNQAISKEKKSIQREIAKIDSKIRAERILPNELGSSLRDNLIHYLGQEQIQDIQNHTFGSETPRELFDLFDQYEQEWKKYIGTDSVKIHAGDKIVLSFEDGKRAWWLLDRGGCREEGDVMGHCGNVPSQRPGDRILSFRTKIQDDWWKPHLTFILDKNGLLGEMKGRGNEKPAERYHPYIVELLKNKKLINGIKGGGYLPQNNFSLDDLDDDVKEQLLNLNPNLMSVFDKFRKSGATPKIIAELEDKHSESNLPGIDSIDKDTTILNSWDNLESFASEYDIEPLVLLFKVFEEQEDLFKGKLDKEEINNISDELTLDPKIYRDILAKMSKETVKKIINDLDMKADANKYSDLLSVAEKIDKTRYGDLIRRAVVRSFDIDNVTDNDEEEADLFGNKKEPKVSKRKIEDDPELAKFIEMVFNVIYRSLRDSSAAIIYDSKDIKNTSVRLELNTDYFVDVLEESFRDYDDSEDEEAWYYAASASSESDWLTIDRWELQSNFQDLEKGNSYDYDKEDMENYQNFLKKLDSGLGNINQDNIDPLDVAREAERMLYYNESRDLRRIRKLAGL